LKYFLKVFCTTLLLLCFLRAVIYTCSRTEIPECPCAVFWCCAF